MSYIPLKGNVETIIVYCQEKENYVRLFRTLGSAINYKCILCNKYVPNGFHQEATLGGKNEA
jgi:hypothetical protein